MISQFDVESGLGFPVKIRADARLPWKMKILGGCVLLTIGVYVYGSWNAGHEAPEKSFLDESVLENRLGDGALYFTTLKADIEGSTLIARECGSSISTDWQKVTVGPFLKKGMTQVQYFAKPGSLGCFVYKNSTEHRGYIKLCGPTPDSCGSDELGYKFGLEFFRTSTSVLSRVEKVTENFPPELGVKVGWEYAYDGADSFVYKASHTKFASFDGPRSMEQRRFTIRATITEVDDEFMLGTATLYFTTLQDGSGERCGSDISTEEQDVKFELFTEANLKTVHYSAPLPGPSAGGGCFVYKDFEDASRHIALCGPKADHCGDKGEAGYEFTFQYFKIAPVKKEDAGFPHCNLGDVTVDFLPELQVKEGWRYAYTGKNSFVYANPRTNPLQFTIRADIIDAKKSRAEP